MSNTTASNTVSSNTTGSTVIDKAPSTASAPSVVINNSDVCVSGLSSAVQTSVFGAAVGTTIRDKSILGSNSTKVSGSPWFISDNTKISSSAGLKLNTDDYIEGTGSLPYVSQNPIMLDAYLGKKHWANPKQ